MTFLDAITRQQLQRRAEHLYRLGPRVQAEFLAELSGRIGGMPAILGLLNEYESLAPEMLLPTGGDRMPPRPLRVVPAS
jgi:hypothetical protein